MHFSASTYTFEIVRCAEQTELPGEESNMSEKKVVSRSEAIQLVRTGKQVCMDLEDGTMIMWRLNPSTFAVRMEGEAVEKPGFWHGDFKSMMKTMNGMGQLGGDFYVKINKRTDEVQS